MRVAVDMIHAIRADFSAPVARLAEISRFDAGATVIDTLLVVR